MNKPQINVNLAGLVEGITYEFKMYVRPTNSALWTIISKTFKSKAEKITFNLPAPSSNVLAYMPSLTATIQPSPKNLQGVKLKICAVNCAILSSYHCKIDELKSAEVIS